MALITKELLCALSGIQNLLCPIGDLWNVSTCGMYGIPQTIGSYGDIVTC